MARTSVPINGGVVVAESRPTGGAVLHIHTGDSSHTLRLDRVAAARLGDALAAIVTAQQTLGEKVAAALDARTFRERIEGAQP